MRGEDFIFISLLQLNQCSREQCSRKAKRWLQQIFDQGPPISHLYLHFPWELVPTLYPDHGTFSQNKVSLLWSCWVWGGERRYLSHIPNTLTDSISLWPSVSPPFQQDQANSQIWKKSMPLESPLFQYHHLSTSQFLCCDPRLQRHHLSPLLNCEPLESFIHLCSPKT